MKKKMLKFFTVCLAFIMALGTTACYGKKGNSDSANTLDIYLLYKGYGDLWLKDAMERFKQADWVKEKYPNLEINYSQNSLDADAHQKLAAGPSINKYDLLFGNELKAYETKGLISDLTDSVYLTEVPGEPGTRVIDKLPDTFRERIKRSVGAPEREDGENSYYMVSYVDGIFGLMYNQDLLDQMELEVPLTTDQFLEVAQAIKEKGYNAKTGPNGAEQRENAVIMNNAKDKYWNDSAFDVWWSHYVGAEAFTDFMNGYDAAEDVYNSQTVLDMPGRLEALTFMQELLTKYQYENSGSFPNHTGYLQAQTEFLMGRGVFHYNGDYFATEMDERVEALKKQGINYNIKYMKMPLFSKIVETLEDTGMSDTLLREVVKAVDDNKTYEEAQFSSAVSKNDFDKIAAARRIVGFNCGTGQSAVIPSYSPAQELASDFLRFMYTDESLKAFSVSSKGLVFPSTYDASSDTSILSSLSNMNISKMELLKGTSNYPITVLPTPADTPLGTGGFTALHYDGALESNFNKNNNNPQTPEQILAAEKSYWKGQWESMLSAAGIR